MKKNTASQKVGAQMVSASDGSAFTGSVTVAVTGDAGTQATGSVGSGACTHEGGGYHTYAPAQAETNYDLIAFTFSGSGAVPATVQVYTDFPQTGDGYSVVNSGTFGNSALKTLIDAIDDFVDTEVAAIKAKTDNLPADTAATLSTIASYIDTEVATIVSQTAASAIRTALGLASANLDTQLGDLPTNAELATALGTADDAVLSAIAALNNLSSAGAQSAAAAALAAYKALAADVAYPVTTVHGTVETTYETP